MSFGKWLIARRLEARLTQQQLAERCGISPNYISALERDEPNARDGSPRRPRIDKVDKIAKVLRADADEARLAAGYAPRYATSPPTNAAELIEAIKRLGVPGLELIGNFEGIENLSPDDYQRLLDSISIAVEVTIRNLLRDEGVQIIPSNPETAIPLLDKD